MGFMNTWPSRSSSTSPSGEDDASLRFIGSHLDTEYRSSLSNPTLKTHHHHHQREEHYPEDSGMIYKKLRMETKRVSQLRNELFGQRLQLKERRNELRQERETLTELDSRFIKKVRHFREFPTDVYDDWCYDELDAQRNLVGTLQYNYDQAEDEHDVYENKLEQKEEIFIKLLSRFLGPDSNEEDNDESTSRSSFAIQSSFEEPGPSDLTDPRKARLMEYESRIGDARIMQERLHDIVFERERRISFIKKRGSFDAGSITSHNSTESFELHYAEADEDLRIINNDVQRLEEELRVNGYLVPEVLASNNHEIIKEEKNEQECDIQENIVWNDGVPTIIEKNSFERENGPKKNKQEKFKQGNEQESAKQGSVGPEGVPAPQFLLPTLPVLRRKERSSSEGFMSALEKRMDVLKNRINRWIYATFGNSPILHVQHKLLIKDYSSVDDDGWVNVMPVFLDGGETLSDERETIELSEQAIKEFERSFPFTKIPKSKATPYKETVELDMLSEYESRSC